MIIDQTLLDTLTEQAKVSPRLRMNYDLRNSEHDLSQRMLNAIEPGSDIPIHRHRKSSETVVIIRGSVEEVFYDASGQSVVEVVELNPEGPSYAVNVPMGQWHTLHSLESGTVIMEIKDGAYEPMKPEDTLPKTTCSSKLH